MPQRNVLFAGEHTSLDFFGFFEGAAMQGWLAAEAILSDLWLARVR